MQGSVCGTFLRGRNNVREGLKGPAFVHNERLTHWCERWCVPPLMW